MEQSISTNVFLAKQNNYATFLAKYAIVLFMLPAVYTGFFPGQITVATFICAWLFIYMLFRAKLSRTDFDGRYIWLLFAVYMLVVYIRGFSNIYTQSDRYAMVVSAVVFCFIFPQLIFLSQPSTLYLTMRSFMVFGICLCAICYFYTPTDAQMSLAHNASFLNVFILCIPFIKKKWWVLIIAGVLFVVLLDVDRRSIMINNVFSLVLISLLFVLKKDNVARTAYLIIIGTTIVLLYLGLSGKYNVFQAMNVMDYQLNNDSRSLFVDSRTGIYEDVFNGLKDKHAYIWGLGFNGRVATSLAETTDATKELYIYGRQGSESGMLNYIQYGGILGFLFYSLLLIVASYKATFHSKNDFMKLLGLFVAFKFTYSFIEDRVSWCAHAFYIFLWIGMCYNKTFRSMSNEQMKLYLGKVFK